MKKLLMVILILAALVGLTALPFINFRIIQSRLAQDSAVGASHAGVEAAPSPASMDTALYVGKGSSFDRALEKALLHELQGQAIFGQVTLLSEPPTSSRSPLLVVEVARRDTFWTPVYATAELEVKAAYAMDGNISFHGTDPITFTRDENSFGVALDGSYTCADVSKGLMTSSGYQSYLAEAVAKTIVESLLKEIK